MRIELEQQVSIAVPAGFQDTIACTFSDSTDEEILIVDRGKIPAGSRTPADIMADRRREFEAGLGTKLHVIQEHVITLMGRAGEELEFTFDLEGTSTHGWFAVAPLNSTEYLQITLTEIGRKSDGPKFDQIIASVSPPGNRSHASKRDGWARQYAGPVTLDVPSNLYPPHAYSFVSADRSTTLQVRLHFPGDPAGSAPTLQQDMARDVQYGAVIENQESTTLAIAGGQGPLVRYVLTKKEPAGTRVEAVQRAQIAFPDRFIVALDGRAPQGSSGQLDATFHELVRTLERLKQ